MDGQTRKRKGGRVVERNKRKKCFTVLVAADSSVAFSAREAGAHRSGGDGTASEKIVTPERSGITAAKSPAEIGETMAAKLHDKGKQAIL